MSPIRQAVADNMKAIIEEGLSSIGTEAIEKAFVKEWEDGARKMLERGWLPIMLEERSGELFLSATVISEETHGCIDLPDVSMEAVCLSYCKEFYSDATEAEVRVIVANALRALADKLEA